MQSSTVTRAIRPHSSKQVANSGITFLLHKNLVASKFSSKFSAQHRRVEPRSRKIDVFRARKTQNISDNAAFARHSVAKRKEKKIDAARERRQIHRLS
jgi:hypothetical protein